MDPSITGDTLQPAALLWRLSTLALPCRVDGCRLLGKGIVQLSDMCDAFPPILGCWGWGDRYDEPIGHRLRTAGLWL